MCSSTRGLLVIAIIVAGFAPSEGMGAAPSTASPEAIKLVDNEANAKDAFSFDFGVPASPALSLLGISPDKVAQSNSLKPFVFALPQLFGGAAEGDAIAFDIAPAWLITREENRTATKYQGGGLAMRIPFRTRAAVGLYEGNDNGADSANTLGSRVTLGFSSSLLDSSDPLLAQLPEDRNSGKSTWRSCLHAAGPDIDDVLSAQNAAPAASPEILSQQRRQLILETERLQKEQALETTHAERRAEIEVRLTELVILIQAVQQQMDANTAAADAALKQAAVNGKVKEKISACVDDANLAARLGADLDIGLGAVRRGDPGEFSDLKSAGWVTWGSYRRYLRFSRTDTKQLSSWSMVGLSVRAGFDEYVKTNDKTVPEMRADSVIGWLGYERYSASNRLTLQIGEEQVRGTKGAPDTFDKSRFRYMATFAQRLGGKSSGLWISAAYGNANGSGAATNDHVFQLTLLFAPPDASNLFGAQ